MIAQKEEAKRAAALAEQQRQQIQTELRLQEYAWAVEGRNGAPPVVVPELWWRRHPWIVCLDP